MVTPWWRATRQRPLQWQRSPFSPVTSLLLFLPCSSTMVMARASPSNGSSDDNGSIDGSGGGKARWRCDSVTAPRWNGELDSDDGLRTATARLSSGSPPRTRSLLRRHPSSPPLSSRGSGSSLSIPPRFFLLISSFLSAWVWVG